MKKGDIVLITFPFTDLKGSKLRPAVVLHHNKTDLTVCFISSQTRYPEFTDILLEPSIENGLKKISVIKTGKIATLNINLAKGLLGVLTPADIKRLNDMLMAFFNL